VPLLATTGTRTEAAELQVAAEELLPIPQQPITVEGDAQQVQAQEEASEATPQVESAPPASTPESDTLRAEIEAIKKAQEASDRKWQSLLQNTRNELKSVSQKAAEQEELAKTYRQRLESGEELDPRDEQLARYRAREAAEEADKRYDAAYTAEEQTDRWVRQRLVREVLAFEDEDELDLALDAAKAGKAEEFIERIAPTIARKAAAKATSALKNEAETLRKENEALKARLAEQEPLLRRENGRVPRPAGAAGRGFTTIRDLEAAILQARNDGDDAAYAELQEQRTAAYNSGMTY
jgi:hypothetical protein